jgi:hypothetical protein
MDNTTNSRRQFEDSEMTTSAHTVQGKVAAVSARVALSRALSALPHLPHLLPLPYLGCGQRAVLATEGYAN